MFSIMASPDPRRLFAIYQKAAKPTRNDLWVNDAVPFALDKPCVPLLMDAW